MASLICGDCLEVMRGMDTDSVDLIYLDPPFNKNRTFEGDAGSFDDRFKDVEAGGMEFIAVRCPVLYGYLTWTRTRSAFPYLAFMGIRLLECRRLLKETGSIYLHCDPPISHYLKTTMDCIFGEENFINEIVWQYDGPQCPSRRRFGSKHDVILRYAKTDDYFSDPTGIAPFRPLTAAELIRYKRLPDGRYFYTTPRGNYTDASVKRLESEDRIEYTKSGNVRIRHFLPTDNTGRVGRAKQLPDVWADIVSLGHAGGSEKVGYPTQKPLALLERIIKASSKEGDMVLDPFCGSGTTCVAAKRLNRRWVGIDSSQAAIDLVRQRTIDKGTHEYKHRKSDALSRQQS